MKYRDFLGARSLLKTRSYWEQEANSGAKCTTDKFAPIFKQTTAKFNADYYSYYYYYSRTKKLTLIGIDN